jgi:hypothetical protein
MHRAESSQRYASIASSSASLPLSAGSDPHADYISFLQRDTSMPSIIIFHINEYINIGEIGVNCGGYT